jgi:prophage regulatory protein
MNPKYLRRPQVSARYGIPPSTLYERVARGLFPKPVRLGRRAVGWPIAELEAWEQERAAERGSARS